MTINNQRPGVYSSYTLTSGYGAPRSQMAAVVIAAGAAANAGELFEFSGYQSAVDMLEAEGNSKILECIRILFVSGVSKVFACVVDESYTNAFALIKNVDNIGAVVCDAAEAADLEALRVLMAECTADMREKIAFVGADTAEKAANDAKRLNSERMVVCCPAAQTAYSENGESVFSAAAMAGRVLAESDLAYNWNGERMNVLTDCAVLGEAEIQALISAGVTVLENRGGVCCIRAITTKTVEGGAADNSMRPINTVLIIDRVMTSLRQSLKARLAGAMLSYESIASQITVILLEAMEDGLIESFDTPVIHASAADSSVCVAELGFKIAHVVSQIHISAHISV